MKDDNDEYLFVNIQPDRSIIPNAVVHITVLYIVKGSSIDPLESSGKDSNYKNLFDSEDGNQDAWAALS